MKKTELLKSNLKRSILLSLLIFISVLKIYGNDNLQNANQFSLEQPKFNQGKYSIALALSQMPRVITGEELAVLPMLEVNYNFQLPSLKMNTGFSSCYLINVASAGAGYDFDLRGIDLNAGINCRYWFGSAKMKGFNSYASGMIASPNVSLAFYAMDMFFTTTAEVDIFINKTYKYGKETFKDNFIRQQGATISLKVEKPVSNAINFYMLAKLSYTKPSYQTWLVNPSKSLNVFIPTLSLGISF